MVAITFLATLLPLLSLTSAIHHSNSPPHLRHRRIANVIEQIRDSHPGSKAIQDRSMNEAHADAHRAIKRVIQKRGKTCRPRGSSPDAAFVQGSSDSTLTSSSSVAMPTASSSSAIDNQEAWAHHSKSSSADNWSQASSTSSASLSHSTGSSGGNGGNGGGGVHSGLLSITDPTCGPSDASDDAPNGSQDWLNCGVTGAGWTPPMVKLDQIIHGELSANGIFSPCADYIDLFNQKGQQYGIPGILLASFAMQESTCNPSATGGNGEAGLMQLTKDNCGGAPGGNCYDVDYNIGRGAELFSGLVDSFGGNVIAACGSYNGWGKMMTIASATAAASQGRCAAQNNLDYLHQFFNGWLQGKNAYTMGTYFNLAHC